MLCLNISNINIITVKNFDYHCIIYNISKSEAIKFIKKIMCLKIAGMHKNIILNFSLFKVVFFFYCFALDKMVDREYSTNI